MVRDGTSATKAGGGRGKLCAGSGTLHKIQALTSFNQVIRDILFLEQQEMNEKWDRSCDSLVAQLPLAKTLPA